MSKVRWGNSAGWSLAGLVGVLIMVLSVGILAVAFAVEPHGGWFFFGTVGLEFVALFYSMVCLGGYQVQYRRELAAGYTCSTVEYVNAAQIDPRTGVVIREPGEPFLSRAERKARTEAARAWAKKSRR